MLRICGNRVQRIGLFFSVILLRVSQESPSPHVRRRHGPFYELIGTEQGCPGAWVHDYLLHFPVALAFPADFFPNSKFSGMTCDVVQYDMSFKSVRKLIHMFCTIVHSRRLS